MKPTERETLMEILCVIALGLVFGCILIFG